MASVIEHQKSYDSQLEENWKKTIKDRRRTHTQDLPKSFSSPAYERVRERETVAWLLASAEQEARSQLIWTWLKYGELVK